MSSTHAEVITVSDRCSRGQAEDRSGPYAAKILTDAGYSVRTRVVPDGVESVRSAVQSAISDGAKVVLTTGGTGIAPRDHTPEALEQIIDRAIPGIAEEIRRQSVLQAQGALLSRTVAGVTGSTFVLAMPGSPAAVATSLDVVLPVLAHILSQLDGGDHVAEQ